MNNQVEKYDFDIIELIKTSFKMTNGFKATFWGTFVIMFAMIFGLAIVLGIVFTLINIDPNTSSNLSSLLMMPIIAPIAAGVLMLTTNYTRGKSVTYKNMFDYFGIMWKLAFASLAVAIIPLVIAGIIIAIGFSTGSQSVLQIFSIIGILLYLLIAISYMFTPQLIADKSLGIWEAMEMSRKAVSQHIWKFLALILLFVIIMMISAIPLGLGLIWTLPALYIATYALPYRIIFDGVELNSTTR